MKESFSKLRCATPCRWIIASSLVFVSFWVVIHDQEAIATIFEFHVWALPLLFFIIFFYELLASWRFSIIGRAAGALNVKLIDWIRLHFVGRFANTLLPQAGNIYRALFLAEDFGISYSSFIGMTAIKAWIESILAFAIAALLLTSFGEEFTLYEVPIYILLFCILIILLIAPFFFFLLLKPSSQIAEIKFLFRVRLRAWNILKTWVYWSGNKKFMFSVTAVTLLILTWSGVAHYAAFAALGVPIELPVLVMFVVLLRVSSYISLTPGNIGIRELMYGITAGLMEFGVAHAVLVSALLRFVTYCVIFPLGFILSRAWMSERKLPK